MSILNTLIINSNKGVVIEGKTNYISVTGSYNLFTYSYGSPSCKLELAHTITQRGIIATIKMIIETIIIPLNFLIRLFLNNLIQNGFLYFTFL